MEKWCMVARLALKTASTIPGIIELTDLYHGKSAIRGVCHDGKNVLFIYIPSDLTGLTVTDLTPPIDATTEQNMKAVGSFLISEQLDAIITAPREILESLFYTDMYRLCCGKHETVEELAANYVDVFGSENLDRSKTLKELLVGVRDDIHAWILTS